MLINIVLLAAALLVVVGLVGMIAVRTLRRFVRSFWPHS